MSSARLRTSRRTGRSVICRHDVWHPVQLAQLPEHRAAWADVWPKFLDRRDLLPDWILLLPTARQQHIHVHGGHPVNLGLCSSIVHEAPAPQRQVWYGLSPIATIEEARMHTYNLCNVFVHAGKCREDCFRCYATRVQIEGQELS